MLKKTKAPKLLSKESLRKIKIAIIRSRFNGELTKNLEIACRDYLGQSGLSQNQISVFDVPGSLEIPLMAQNLAMKKSFDAIIALGVIIKGDTYHFEIVADNCARGCMEVSLKHNIPVIFEVVCAYSLAQAKKRTGAGKNNKGREAAQSALEMIKSLSSV